MNPHQVTASLRGLVLATDAVAVAGPEDGGDEPPSVTLKDGQ
jgi:hypothetical protein